MGSKRQRLTVFTFTAGIIPRNKEDAANFQKLHVRYDSLMDENADLKNRIQQISTWIKIMQFIVELTAYALMLWVLPYLVLYVFNNPVQIPGLFLF